MNSKDLLSINEAFAKASSKVTADEPAKKDEVVTEDTETVSEAAPEALKTKKKETDDEELPKEDTEDETVEEDGIHNMMDNYEKSLSQNFGVKSVKEKATDQRPKDEVKADE